MIERYHLNYGWGHQPGWTEDTEITLLGHVTGKPAVSAVTAWVETLPRCERPQEAWRRYDGGATLEIVETSPGGDGLELAIRSTGRDAFDSVAWYADVVTDLVLAADTASGAADESTGGAAADATPVTPTREAAGLRWTEVPLS